MMAAQEYGVLLIGAGGLGSAVALALGESGLPLHLGLADGDQVALSNLHRQLLYRSGEIGQEKTGAAARRLHAEYPRLRVTVLPRRLDGVEAITQACGGFAVVVDGSDNFSTRFAANDAALAQGFPLIHGAATGMRGQLMTILPGASACLRCLFGAPPEEQGPTCQQAGILPPLVGEVGWLMAMETVKVLCNLGGLLVNRLLTIDLNSGQRRQVPLRPNPACVCRNYSERVRIGPARPHL